MKYSTRGYMCRDIVYRLYHRVFMITRARKHFFFLLARFFSGMHSYDNGHKQNHKAFTVIYHMFAHRRFFHIVLRVYAYFHRMEYFHEMFFFKIEVDQNNF